jgi:hypothetical protein
MKLHPEILALSLLLVATSCSSGDGGGGSGASGATGTLHVVATDSPFEHALVAAASIDVVKVRIHEDENAQSGFTTLYDGPPITIQLDQLRNGIMQALTSGVLPVGTYSQIRLHLSSATLELVNGNVYTTADGTLQFTNQSTSGYKITLDPPVDVPDGGVANVLLDIDLTKTFVPVPANDPATASKYILRPNVRAAVLELAGEVRVTVLESDGEGGTVGVPNASVYLLLPGETDVANSVASTATDAVGSAAILGITPGTYDVLAVEGARNDRADAVSVTAGNVTAVELVLP